MPFTCQPSRTFLIAEQLLPESFRTTALQFVWAAAGIAVVLALLGGPALMGLAFLFLAVASAYSFAFLYFAYGIEEPPLTESLASAMMRDRRGDVISIVPFCSAEAISAFPAMQEPTVPRILGNLLEHPRADLIFKRLGIVKDEVLWALAEMERQHKPVNDEVARVLTNAAEHAVRQEHDRVLFSDALIAFAKASPVMRDVLFNRELSLDDFAAVAHWEDRLEHIRERRKRFWERDALFAIKPFGREWTYGYTPTIDKFAINLSASIEGREQATERTLGHTRVVAALERSLAKTSSTNALLIYEPGVGVRDAIATLTGRVSTGRSLPILNYRRVLAADFGAAISGLKTAGEIEGRVRRMLGEAARAGGTILVVENFHQLLGGEIGGQPIDLTATFLPFLEGSRIQIVATATYTGLHEVLEKREGVLSLFEKAEVKEPDAELTVQALLESLPFFERRFQVYVTYPVLKEIIELADQTIQDVPFPKKGFDVLEEAMIAAQNQGETLLTKQTAARIISERTHIPVGALTKSEQEKLKNLELLLHQRIVGQDHAITTIANALRRARAGVRGGEETRPIGTFLFMGPTGVGKTETAKAIAEVYFGSEDLMLRLDMSEFNGVDAVDRLIGSPATKEEGRLSTIVRENPFAVLLLDEFEKMHKNAMDLFLPVFDEGIIKDGWGRKVTFTNILIIATSNAGAEFIREYLERSGDDEKLDEELREEVLRKGILRPELMNRFDGTIVFKPLSKEQVREIAHRMLKRFSDTLYDEKGIRVEVVPEALEIIIERGFKQEFGARELRRVLQESVETVVAKRILAGEAKRGDTIAIYVADLRASA